MNWLAIFFAIELGISPNLLDVTSYERTMTAYEYDQAMYVEFDAEVELFKYIFKKRCFEEKGWGIWRVDGKDERKKVIYPDSL